MIIILHDHDQTLRVGHVPPATVLELAGLLSGTAVRLHVRPDEETSGRCALCGSVLGGGPPHGCTRDSACPYCGAYRPADPGYFGLAVALARRTWQD